MEHLKQVCKLCEEFVTMKRMETGIDLICPNHGLLLHYPNVAIQRHLYTEYIVEHTKKRKHCYVCNEIQYMNSYGRCEVCAEKEAAPAVEKNCNTCKGCLINEDELDSTCRDQNYKYWELKPEPVVDWHAKYDELDKIQEKTENERFTLFNKCQDLQKEQFEINKQLKEWDAKCVELERKFSIADRTSTTYFKEAHRLLEENIKLKDIIIKLLLEEQADE